MKPQNILAKDLNLIFDGDFKKRSEVHLARKIWHMLGVFGLFVAWNIFSFKISLALLSVAWILFVPADIIRLYNPKVNKLLTKLFKPIMRQNELNKPAGTTYLLTGVILIGLIFQNDIVSISLLFLAFADPIASYVGIRYGKDKIFGHKSVQGFIAAFVVCFLITFSFLYYKNIQDYLFFASLLAGLIGALAELIPIAKLDDNFTMPVISAFGVDFVFKLFSILEHLK